MKLPRYAGKARTRQSCERCCAALCMVSYRQIPGNARSGKADDAVRRHARETGTPQTDALPAAAYPGRFTAEAPKEPDGGGASAHAADRLYDLEAMYVGAFTLFQS